jgi:phosphatidylserine/phosphatidylglycerophosphate/cardiolipin synthase-like enzyme
LCDVKPVAFTADLQDSCEKPNNSVAWALHHIVARPVLGINALDHATNNVLVQAYSFTSAPIANALVDAHKRGVNVQVILDKSQRTEKYSSADFVARAGIPTFIDAKHAIAHNKIMVIDGYEILTGSFNFTKAAEVSPGG